MNAKRFSTACATSALLLASLGGIDLARAETESPHAFSANVALTTNYMFRGVSQTDNGPAIQGGFNYNYKPYGLYAGVWASNVSSEGYDGASMELDIVAGWAPTWDKLGMDLGYIRYEYPMTDTNANNTNEFHLGLSYDLGYFTPSYTANYSDDFFGLGSSWYQDLKVAIPLPYEFKLTGHYGWNQFEKAAGDYEDYSVSLSRDFYGFGFSLAWVDRSNSDDCSAPFQCGSTAVFTVSKTF